MEHLPTWFRFPHLLILLLSTIVLFFLYQITNKIFCKPPSCTTSNLEMHRTTKAVLISAITVSYSYLLIASIQTSFMFIPFSSGAHSYPTSLCPYFASLRLASYITGRSLLYLFFICRTNDIFHDTIYRFSPRCKSFVVIYTITATISIVLPATYIFLFLQEWHIITTDHTHIGSFCSAHGAAEYAKYVFLWGSLNDSFYAFVSLFLMISKLFQLIIESENRAKSVHSRFSIHTQLASLDRDCSSDRLPSVSPSVSNGNTEVADFPDFAGPYLTVSSSAARSTFGKKRSSVTPKTALEFHRKTADQNDIILLISKFFILLCCVVLTSQCVLVLFLLFKDTVLILYSVDTFTNLVCLYLSFTFSDVYYNKYLCGKCCTKRCFPLIKTITMHCSAYERHQNYGQQQVQSRCWTYCKCCCFGYCCDEKIDLESTINMYQLAKFEVDLMVMQTANTSSEEAGK